MNKCSVTAEFGALSGHLFAVL